MTARPYPEAIQDLNGGRQIDYRRDTILGAHNIYDVGQRLTEILTRDDVVDADDAAIGDDVKEKLLRFGRAAVAAASMRGKSYLQIGSICMGIDGSIIDSDFLESYLGLRVESVDEVKIIRRMSEGIYAETEYQKALAWAKEKCIIGFDKNPDFVRKSDEVKEEQFDL